MSSSHLPPHLLASFKEAYLKDIGKELTDEEANVKGNELLDLVMTLAGHPSMIPPAKQFESRSVSKGSTKTSNTVKGSTKPRIAKLTRG